jgi:LCP family protein required for cell wall assembly
MLFTLLGPPLCGVLVAVLVAAAWLVVGAPDLAKGETWLRLDKFPPSQGASFTAGEPSQVQFFVVVGNDSRDPSAIGLGDALHVVGVNPGAHAATIIDIPRDTTVPLAGGGRDKINAALSTGGLKRLVDTVQDFVGVPITYALTTNFDNFIKMVDEIGGVDINIQTPMHDEFSGADFQPGPTHLDGDAALRFSRDRHSFPTGDIKRTENQGYLIISALQTIQQRNVGPAGTLELLGALSRHVVLQNASLVDLYRLARLVLTINPQNIKNVVIPTGSGAGSDLTPGAGIQDLFNDFKDDGILQSH